MKTKQKTKTISAASPAPERTMAPHCLQAKAHPTFACHSRSHPGPQPVFPASSPLPTSQAGLLTLPLTRLKHSHLHAFPPTWNALPIPVYLLCARHYAECFRLLTPQIGGLRQWRDWGITSSPNYLSALSPPKQSKYKATFLYSQF